MNLALFGAPAQRFGHVCEKISITNCLTPETAKKCKICKENFFLDSEGKCVKFPVPRITHCLTYQQNYDCDECENEFYLKFNACVAVEIIPFCLRYNGRASFPECVECQSDYFVNGGQCVKRQISLNISGCMDVDLKSDNCE